MRRRINGSHCLVAEWSGYWISISHSSNHCRCSVSGSVAPVLLGTIYQAVIQAAGGACHLASSQHRIVINWYKHSYKRPPAHSLQFLRAQFATQTSQTCVSVYQPTFLFSISVSLRQNDLVPCCCFAAVLPRLTPAWWLAPWQWYYEPASSVLMCVCLKSQQQHFRRRRKQNAWVAEEERRRPRLRQAECVVVENIEMYSVLRLLHYPHNIHYSRYILCPYKSGLSVTSDEDCCCRCEERSKQSVIRATRCILHGHWSG